MQKGFRVKGLGRDGPLKGGLQAEEMFTVQETGIDKSAGCALDGID